jgi:(2Fe-2S) ferredoxin/2-polyprenyl-3-methyl-5-hydroxy-6-metoxy-1,4-benzoquinol methylase
MEPFRYHVYVCDQKKPEGAPCCSARGSQKTIDALRAEIAKHSLGDTVQVTTCGSLGLCGRGPNMVVYPDGIWYSGVTPEDVAEIVRMHFGSGLVVERLANRDGAILRAKINDNKRKYLAALKAKDEAGLLPDELNEAIRAFQPSRTLLTAIELDVFTAVGVGATAAEVAAKISADPRATEMLLNALVALDMLTKQDGVFRNSRVAARYFVAGSPDDARAAMMHTVHLWRNWSTLTRAVRAGTAVTSEETRGEDWTATFIAAMDYNAKGRAALIANTVDAASVRRMLDIGGGSGACSIACARANANLHADILDLPTVVPIAQKYIDAAGLADRVHPRAGDLRSDAFGKDYDLVLISSVCHMLGEEENRALLAKAFEALAPGGRLVIQDFILDPDKTGPRKAALFSLHMLVNTAHGSAYSAEEYSRWLTEAGFPNVERVRLPGPTGLMIGKK